MMPLDYSKWDNLEVSDSDDDPKPRVIKLDRSEQVELNRDGYNIVSGGQHGNRAINLVELSKFWKKRLKNGMVFGRSHIFSQDRYDLSILIAVRADEGKPRFEVVVSETTLTIRREGCDIFNKEFFAKVKSDDDTVNWQVMRKDVDWKALQNYCRSKNQNIDDGKIDFTEIYEQTFIELELKKHNDIADCFIWWPKVFKDDEESIHFDTKGGTAFMESWNKAHEQFRERVKKFEKVQL